MTIHTTTFSTRLGIDYPIVQGPMNGASSPELAAAVSNAGGLGSFAAALLSPEAIIDGIRKVRALTSKPFNVNLFVLDTPVIDPVAITQSEQRLAPFRESLGLPVAPTPTRFSEVLAPQLAALLEAAPPVVSFTFGILDASQVAQFKRAGCQVIGTATTVSEALAWEQAGADFICAQGAEAGGHRGTFMGDVEQSCIGLMALIPQVAAAVAIPVIAAGGIMNGRGIVAALTLGAQAAQLGTAFLSCPECPIPQAWKAALLTARDDSTRLTRTFSGRYARGIVNDFMEQMRPYENDVPSYPIQNALTGPLRQAAGKLGRADMIALWAGQGVSMSRTMAAADLVRTLAAEMAEVARA
ncbi:nitronate monooxygenase [Actimicrobium antarcticum]|uniref:Propionate 3-nitronate monooxygenase n=1 Tax=Actimicrobium antarcticum TaxID=1051899 RepID=A0ABP7T9X2_9BURK